MALPTVSRLFIHPIKSLDRISVPEARLLPDGAFAHDRECALYDQDGHFVNGKRQSRVHLIQAEYNLVNFTVTLRGHEQPDAQTFHLLDERTKLEEWFSDFFGFPVTVEFAIGQVRLHGINPCQRCIVPSRHPGK